MNGKKKVLLFLAGLAAAAAQETRKVRTAASPLKSGLRQVPMRMWSMR